MLDNRDLFIDTKKLENGNWEVSLKHIPTGLNYSCSNSKSQKENLKSCKKAIETMLEFYNFCSKRESHWNGEELTFLLDNEDINDFVKIIGKDYFCEGDVKVTLMGDYIGFDLVPFCEHMEVEPELLLEKN